ncbi:2-hydroxychromene-2-carboxylate isomerase [Bradyrhizobium sp.]|uniref:2-hydroxychromene-2-carboxylate isomerase n=1 Tax=Bradyrhizobium sp. TaxID=376 RepID=UPI004038230A
MTRTVEFYFDFPSPYSYLAHTQLPKIAAEHGATLVYRPFRVLELMTIVGNRPTTIECKNKGKYAGADLQRWTRRYNVEFSRNPHSRSLDFAALDRGALVAIEDGRGAEYVTTVFAAIWGRPADLSQRSVLIDILERAGLDASALVERANTEAIVARLDAETKAAAERGVFGAPTVFVGNQMFFGNDRLDFVAEALRSAI